MVEQQPEKRNISRKRILLGRVRAGSIIKMTLYIFLFKNLYYKQSISFKGFRLIKSSFAYAGDKRNVRYYNK